MTVLPLSVPTTVRSTRADLAVILSIVDAAANVGGIRIGLGIRIKKD